MRQKILVIFLALAVLASIPAGVLASGIPSFNFATPVFGLAVAPDGSLLVADGGSGIVELRGGSGSLVTSLPGVTDIAPVGRGDLFAVTGIGGLDTSGKLFRISRGGMVEVANLTAFEGMVNPDGGEIDSNPFDVEVLNGGKVLVADAGGNDLLIVDQSGKVDWVATLPAQLISTDYLKSLVGCPDAPQSIGFFCGLPAMIPAEPVATSVAVGPDGAYYVGELTGFPGAVGSSRVWRIEPGTLHAQCGSSPACQVVLSGFTSIVDLAFGPKGKLYVVEMDEATFMAIELAGAGLTGLSQGGSVNACDLSTSSCSVVATGLPMPIATTVDRSGKVYAAIASLVPGAAQVIELP